MRNSEPVPGRLDNHDSPSSQQKPRISSAASDQAVPASAASSADFERAPAIAGRLSSVAEASFDELMTDCLRQLVELLGVDRGTILGLGQGGDDLRVMHCWAREGLPVPAAGTPLEKRLPWYTHQLRSGHIVHVASAVDLPGEAQREKEFLLECGQKSAIAVPLIMEGAVIGALAFGTFEEERKWSRWTIAQVRLVAEVVALSVRRHQYAFGVSVLAEHMDQLLLAVSRLQQSQGDRYRHIALNLMKAEYDERQRMAEMIHEDIMQSLVGAGMFLEVARDGESPDRANTITRCHEMLRQALRKLRQLMMELHASVLSGHGIVDDLRWLADQMRRTHDLFVEVREEASLPPVSEEIRPFLYDSARKLLDNVVRHAKCRQASIEIQKTEDGRIRLTVSDEGIGFTPPSPDEVPAGSVGLFSIHEQAELLGGHLEIQSAPGAGCKAIVTLLP